MNLDSRNSIAQDVVLEYEKRKDEFLNILKELVRIPSVSFAGYEPLHLKVCAQAIADDFAKYGLGCLETLETTGGPPCLFGEWGNKSAGHTVLLYSHYDVQPPLSEDLWLSPPFETSEKNGRLFGRGVGDDKAGVVAHLAAIASFLSTAGNTSIKIKLLLEGEEEVGSPHLQATLSRHAKKLETDSVLILDGSNYSAGLPTITTSMRGLASLTVCVSVADHALHSGLWGGPIPDPAMALAKILSGIVDSEGNLALKGLLENAALPTEDELLNIRDLRMTSADFRTQAGIKAGVALFAEDDDILVRLWHRPTVTINSMIAGDKKTAGNVLLDSAWARIGIRLVSGMEPVATIKALADYLREKCPWGLNMEIVFDENASPGWKAQIEHPIYTIAREAYSEGYRKPVVFAGNGATVPIVAMIGSQMPKAVPILVGVLDPKSNPHAENESLLIEDFHSAVRSEIRFLAKMATPSDNP